METRISVLGDFNIDLAINHFRANKLTLTMSSFGLENLVFRYTRKALGSQSIIDHVFTNIKIAKVKVLCTALSDYYAQSTSMLMSAYFVNKKQEFKSNQVRIFDEENVNTFKYLLKRESWSGKFDSENIDNQYNYFSTS